MTPSLRSAIALLTTLPAAAFAASVNFDTAGDLSSNFNVIPQFNSTNNTNGFSESPGSGGISTSPGSVAYNQLATNDATAVFLPQSFSFATDGVSLNETFYFHLGTAAIASAQRVLQLGFLAGNSAGLNGTTNQAVGTAFTSLRVNTPSAAGNSYTFELQDKTATGSTATAGATNVALTLGDWYSLSITLTNAPGVDTYTMTGSLQDLGTTGITPIGAPVVFAPLTRTLAGIDTTLYGAFRGNNVNNVTNYDTYSVTTSVPEPATAAFLLFGGLALSVNRRRRTV